MDEVAERPTESLESADSVLDEGSVSKVPRMLFLHPGPSRLHDDPRYNMHAHIGAEITGAGVYGSWAASRQECLEWRALSEPACGGFAYRPVPTLTIRPEALRPILTVRAMYREAMTYVRESRKPIDIVVGYSPYGVGLAAWLVSWRLGVPLIIQVQNDLNAAFSAQPGRNMGFKRVVAHRLARFVLSRARGWHLYFAGQTGSVRPRADQKVFYLTDFTPVSMVPVSKSPEREFLMVGYPWSVKGVDLAIRAFKAAGPSLSGWKLRVVGHCPDRSPYEALAEGDSRIEFEKAVLHKTALDMIANCGVYVLCSRTEAYGRVAIEAMAAGRPVIGSRVGGIPNYVQHEATGLLVDSENVDQLRDAMVRLATDEALRQRLGSAGRARVQLLHTEKLWAEQFTSMIHSVTDSR